MATNYQTRDEAAGAGWLLFAAAMLITAGVFRILDAFWAFKYDDEISDQVQTIVFENDLGAYGWVWLLLGILLIAAGFAIGNGAQWARWIGIIAGAVLAISSMSWIYFQPFWSFVGVTMGILVVYALSVYGGREPV
jgi:hypothetical protein